MALADIALIGGPAPDPKPKPEPEPEPRHYSLSAADKVALFRCLFHDRTDVYPVRWEGRTLGKSGYTQTCANE